MSADNFVFNCFICVNETNCDAIFANKDDLKTHICEIHLKSFDYQCELCIFPHFSTSSSLREHYAQSHHITTYTLRRVVTPNTIILKAKLNKLIQMSTFNVNNDVAVVNSNVHQFVFENVIESVHTQIEFEQSNAADEKKASLNIIDQYTTIDTNDNESVTNEHHRIDEKMSKSAELNDINVIKKPKNYANLAGNDKNTKSLDNVTTNNSASKHRLMQSLKKSNKLDCIKCELTIENIKSSEALRQHVAIAHLNVVMFKCRQCPFTSNSYLKSEITRHIRQMHQSTDTSLIVDLREKHHDALIVGVRECFNVDAERFCKKTNFARKQRILRITKNRKLQIVNSRKSIRNANNRRRPKVDCKKCGKRLQNEYRTKSAHACMHLDISPIVCHHCAFTSRWIKNMKKHLRNEHKSIESNEFDDNRNEYETELNNELNECFDSD